MQTTIVDMAPDAMNFLWLSYPNGMQRFDGRHFTEVPVQPGLEDNKWCKFLTDEKLNLYIGHDKGISYYDVATNAFTYLVKFNGINASFDDFLGIYKGVLFWHKKGTIIGYDIEKRKIVFKEMPFKDEQAMLLMKTVGSLADGQVWIRQEDADHIYNINTKSVQKIDLPGLALDIEPQDKQFTISYVSKDKIISRLYDERFKPGTVIYEKTIGSPAPRCGHFKWKGKPYRFLGSNIWAVENDHVYWVNKHNEPVFKNGVPSLIAEDKNNNLYIASVLDGLYKITGNSNNLRYYGNNLPDQNFTVSLTVNEPDNRVIAGYLGRGIKVFDTAGKELPLPEKTFKRFENSSVVAICQLQGDGYLVFCFGRTEITELDRFMNIKKGYRPSETDAKTVGYYNKCIYNNERFVVLQSDSRILRFDRETGSLKSYLIPAKNTMTAEMYDGKILIYENNALNFFDSSTQTLKKMIDLPQSGGVRSMKVNKANELIIGTNKGVFVFDKDLKQKHYYNKEAGLPDECIYALETDVAGTIWCSSNKGIFGIFNNGSVQRFTKEDGLQESEFNTNISFAAPSGKLYFGGINGINSFSPDTKIDSLRPQLLVTNIRIGNNPLPAGTAPWNVSSLKVPWYNNQFVFEFIASGKSLPESYVYQYKMQGLDQSWLENSNFQNVRYSLPPGEYLSLIHI